MKAAVDIFWLLEAFQYVCMYVFTLQLNEHTHFDRSSKSCKRRSCNFKKLLSLSKVFFYVTKNVFKLKSSQVYSFKCHEFPELAVAWERCRTQTAKSLQHDTETFCNFPIGRATLVRAEASESTATHHASHLMVR